MRTFNDIFEVYDYLNDYFKFSQAEAVVPRYVNEKN